PPIRRLIRPRSRHDDHALRPGAKGAGRLKTRRAPPGPTWLGREDSNLRMRDPKSRALPLGHAPPTERDFRHGPQRLWAQRGDGHVAAERKPGEKPRQLSGRSAGCQPGRAHGHGATEQPAVERAWKNAPSHSDKSVALAEPSPS